MNKKIKKRLSNNLKKWKQDLMLDIDNNIKNIEGSENIHQLMFYKGELLRTIIDKIPLSDDECYFCLLQLNKGDGLTCEKCKYAKVHGMCIDDENSTFNKICNCITNLSNIIKTYSTIE